MSSSFSLRTKRIPTQGIGEAQRVANLRAEKSRKEEIYRLRDASIRKVYPCQLKRRF